MSHKSEITFLCLFLVSLLALVLLVSFEGDSMAAKPIKEVITDHARTLLSIPGVVGAGEGLCKGVPCIKVFVTKKTPELEKKILDTLEGYPVEIEETGEIRPLPKNQN